MAAILVVENDDLEMGFILSILRETLSESYSVITASTGAQAIRAAKQNRPELILIDILLPDLDGTDVIAEIRRFLPDSIISIQTACTDFYCAQKAIRLQVMEYLLKPVKPKELKNLLWRMEECAKQTPRGSLREKASAEDAPSTEKEMASFMEEAMHYIHSHFEEKLNLQDVAGQVFINSQYFSRVFKREIGVTFTEYVNDLRVRKACDMLKNTSYPAYRIANECGFSDPSYFNRIFLRCMGTTPQKYRRLRRNDDTGEKNDTP